MNFIQKLLHKYCDVEYVLLFTKNKQSFVCRAYRIRNDYYSHGGCAEYRVLLLPEGMVEGYDYFCAWKPITPLMAKIFHDKLG